MGCTYITLPLGSKVIIENPETRLQRMQYLRTMKKIVKKATNVAVLYVDEMWLYNQYEAWNMNEEIDLGFTWPYIEFEKRAGYISQPNQTPVTNIDPIDLKKYEDYGLVI